MVHIATTIEDEEDEEDEKDEKKGGEEEEEEGQILQPQPQPTSVLLYLHYYVLPLFHTIIRAPLARVFQNSDRWSV